MVKLLILLTLTTMGCDSLRTRTLDDNLTKVPSDPVYFETHYRDRHNVVIPEGVDLKSIYIEDHYIDHMGKKYPVAGDEYTYIAVLKFYENGGVNKFLIKKGELNSTSLNLNPSHSGYRGIVYKDEGRHNLSLLVPVNELRKLGEINYELSVTQQYLALYNSTTRVTYFYRRQALPVHSAYNADW